MVTMLNYDHLAESSAAPENSPVLQASTSASEERDIVMDITAGNSNLTLNPSDILSRYLSNLASGEKKKKKKLSVKVQPQAIAESIDARTSGIVPSNINVKLKDLSDRVVVTEAHLSEIGRAHV